jgi:threonine dehydrogenase-like Zn-dependent dehydrogenase
MTDSTRVAVLTNPFKIELVEREIPAVGPTEVRVRVAQCGICTSELDLWTGKDLDKLPTALGHEVAGEVEDVGDEVRRLRPGDTVAAWVHGGGFADQVVVEERFCVPVTQSAPFPAVAEPLACVVNAVELAAPKLADHVVIIGAGFMGNLVQLVTALKGPRSIVVADIRGDALRRAERLGATRVVDTTKESLVDVVKEVSGGDGADLTYEVTGINAGLELAGDVTRMSGTVCIVGYHQGGTRVLPLARWNWMAFKLVNAHFREIDTIMHGMKVGMSLVEGGILDASTLVTGIYPLTRIEEAFTVATKKPEGFVKAVVEPAA